MRKANISRGRFFFSTPTVCWSFSPFYLILNCCVSYNLCLFEKQTVYHMPRLIVDFSQDSMSRKRNNFATIRHYSLWFSAATILGLKQWQGLTKKSWSPWLAICACAWVVRWECHAVTLPDWSLPHGLHLCWAGDSCELITKTLHGSLMDTWVATLTFSLHTSTHALKNN